MGARSGLAGGKAAARAALDERIQKKMLEEFDADGNGELSDEEKATARETLAGRHGRRGRGGRGGAVGEGGEGRERPDREEMLKKYDTDGDGELSESERQKMREEMGGRRGGGEGRGGGGGRGR